MGLIAESYGVGHLCDVYSAFIDEARGLFQTDVSDEFSCRDTGDLLHLAMKLRTTYTYFFGQLLYIEL